jgi:putative molybdopterin biosynthesis protein
MTEQEQFLEVVDRDLAAQRFQAALDLNPLGEEIVSLDAALGHVVARDIVAPIDVPSFDRSNVDGFAVRAADTYGAREEAPRRLRLVHEPVATGVVPQRAVGEGKAVPIATGGMLPRGADAVLMVEHADVAGLDLFVRKPVCPGQGVTFTGTDIAAGEYVLRLGERLTSRETGLLAAVGVERLPVWRPPQVAILSTGDELIPPSHAMRPGLVFDSNSQILADAVRELGGLPLRLGIVPDDIGKLTHALRQALEQADVVLLSGGTSKGAGDVCYRAVAEVCDPGIVAHGVALKPGKPICLAAHRGRAVVVLPGFPTSAVFTFHEFVAPVILRLAGRTPDTAQTVSARLAVKIVSEIGRTEYVLVALALAADGTQVAYPMGKGSGSVTAFSRADGFLTIGRQEEIVEAGATVSVQLLGRDLRPADLVVVGSHCIGLDYLLGRLQHEGFHTKFLPVGSSAGLAAAQAQQCDVAGIHLLDPATDQYNRPFLTPELELLAGYRRRQGLVFRRGDDRFAGDSAAEVIARVAKLPDLLMVNRNAGSGTRILIDQLLQGLQPPGYAVQAKTHNGVAAAVAQGRADWGLAIESVARRQDLGFLPLRDEQFDFVIPQARSRRPALAALRRLLSAPDVAERLRELGCWL